MAAFCEHSTEGHPQALTLVVSPHQLARCPIWQAYLVAHTSSRDVTMKATGGVPAWRLIVLFFVTSFVISFANLPCQSVCLIFISAPSPATYNSALSAFALLFLLCLL